MSRVARLVVLAALAAAPAAAGAQQARVSGTTAARYVSARVLREDSVPISQTVGDGVLRYTAEGVAVRCLDATSACHYLAPGDVARAVPLMQDLSVAVWGLGRGVSVHAQLRLRPGVLGDEALWPRGEDRLEALEAYLEISRRVARVRIGRQWQASGLGAYAFDGAAVQLSYAPLLLDVYGGWSLLRGLAEPATSDALAAIEPFAPDDRALLLGARLQLRGPAGSGGSLAYQREIRSDRLGLYSERATADAYYRRGRFSVEGAGDMDVATGLLNHLRVDARVRPAAYLELDAFGRHYRPYFDLWTIWGAFAPTGFNEVGGGASVNVSHWPLAATLELAHRTYQESDAELSFARQRSDGWRATASLAPRLPAPWTALARYGMDVGFGSARNELSLRLRRDFGRTAHLGIDGSVFDRASDYQVTDGVVLGGSLDGAIRLSPRTRASGHFMAWRHLGADGGGADWTQTRALLQLEWVLGHEPGMSGGGHQ